MRYPTQFVNTLEKLNKSKKVEVAAEKQNPYGIPSTIDEFLKLCRIRSGINIVPFKIYPYQSKLNEIIDTHQGTMILKDRQLGITEYLGGRILFKALHNPAYFGAVISINQDKASEVGKRVKKMPATLPLAWEYASNTILKPKGAGEAQFLPSTENAIRSLPSVTELVFDEAGFIPKFAELYGAGTSAQEMVPASHRKTILNTTVPVDGTLSEFWGMFAADNGSVDAEEMVRQAREAKTNCDIPGMIFWTDENGWAKVILSHTVQDKYNYPDYLTDVCKRRKIPLSIAQREHNLGIETAQGCLFNSGAISLQATGGWSAPLPTNRYFVMIDPNFGGADNWVTLVFDITAGCIPSLVAEYAESGRSTDYSIKQTLKLIDDYNSVLTAVESNSGGKVIAERLVIERPDKRFEVTMTTKASKIVNTDRIAIALEQGEVIYPPGWLGMKEMQRFSLAEREATGGEKDDRIMAWAAGWAWLDAALIPEAGGAFTTQDLGTPMPMVDSFGRRLR